MRIEKYIIKDILIYLQGNANHRGEKLTNTEYLKIPRERVGVVIGKQGITKEEIEKATQTLIDSGQ